MIYTETPHSEPRTEGVLQVDHLDRYQTRFAIGQGPFVYVRPAQVTDAQARLEAAGTETVLLAGYWLDEQDVAALA